MRGDCESSRPNTFLVYQKNKIKSRTIKLIAVNAQPTGDSAVLPPPVPPSQSQKKSGIHLIVPPRGEKNTPPRVNSRRFACSSRSQAPAQRHRLGTNNRHDSEPPDPLYARGRNTVFFRARCFGLWYSGIPFNQKKKTRNAQSLSGGQFPHP